MSKYTLLVKNNINYKSEIKEATEILKSGDCITIFGNDNIEAKSILNAIKDENLDYKHITDGKKEYILAKKYTD